jgi:tRNA-splicing ligase RtcB
MSFKNAAEKVADGHYRLEKGLPVAVDVFLDEDLYNKSEEEAWRQMATAARMPGVRRVAVTPDTHTGYGVPIGIVIETEGTLLPTAAGYDISCGMVQLETTLTADDVRDPKKRRNWITSVTDQIGIGVGMSGSRGLSNKRFEEVLRRGALALGISRQNSERDYIPVDEDVDSLERATEKSAQLGSLGGGNHFCELQVDEDQKVWAMIHTGSRGFGYKTAETYFFEGAAKLGLRKGERDLVWFDAGSRMGRAYWNHHNMAANFAIANRLLIGEAVCRALEDVFGGTAKVFYEISHNLIQEEGERGSKRFVHRKGATRAFPAGHHALEGTKWEKTGHPILIPGSMQTGSAILYASEGANKSIYSVNHGSGRLMSRSEAKRRLNQKDVNESMESQDILINTRNVPIDESGPCYKDLDQVLNVVEVAGLAKVAKRLRPVAVIKGND